jgi:alpha-D-ribose 1-methylphosphonate 5-triphosphate diphosphatase
VTNLEIRSTSENRMSDILCNARLVLPDRVLRGSVKIADGLIVEINEGASVPRDGIDLDGDFLIPGLVDLHSDNLEKHYAPRPRVEWPALAAVLAHDAAVIGAGITTILNSLALAGSKNGIDRGAMLRPMIEGLETARAKRALRAEHFLELRCEIGKPDIVARCTAFESDASVRLISLMDHTPGQRQYTTRDMWLAAYRGSTGLAPDALVAFMEQEIASRDLHGKTNYARLAELARARAIPLASHDDATHAHVDEAVAAGAAISQFPTTAEAASSARRQGMSVLMGAPNIVRGRSHVGNLSAAECAREGLLDILASDYVPASLLHATFLLTRDPIGLDLPRAIAIASENPARAVGLADRGAIIVGRRADLVQVDDAGLPIVRQVWNAGRRVH